MISINIIPLFVTNPWSTSFAVAISVIFLVLSNLYLSFDQKKSTSSSAMDEQEKLRQTKNEPQKNLNPPWVDEELIIALDFYHTHSPNIPHKKSIEIQELSTSIQELQIHSSENRLPSFRNTDGVYANLMNFRSFDRTHDGKGLSHGSVAAKKLWIKYIESKDMLRKDAENIKVLFSSPTLKFKDFKTDKNKDASDSLIQIIDIYNSASSCSQCFETDPLLNKDKISGGQPRWVGHEYFSKSSLKPKVVILLKSPGQLGKSKQFSISKYNELMTELKRPNHWQDLMAMIDADSVNWGRFDSIYKINMDLDMSHTAIVNIAMCSGINNEKKHLSRCFNEHTRPMLEILQPNILILNGLIVQDIYDQEVSLDSSQLHSKKLIEQNFVTNDYFKSKPVYASSYAARSSNIPFVAEEIGEQIKQCTLN